MSWCPARRPGWFWAVLVTLLGAFLRWHRLGDTRILWDHAYPVAQAVRLLQTGVWPTLGQPTSFFLSNPPGQAYLSLLPMAIWNSFWLTFWFMTTLNVLSVPLLYSLTRRYVTEKTAIIASFLYAVSPWVIDYSRASWSSAMLPVGCVLVLGLLLRALAPAARHKSRSLFAMFASLALLGQTYFLALILVPVQAAGVILTRWRAIAWRGLLWGAALFAVGLLTYGAAVAANFAMQLQQAGRASQDAGTHATFMWQAVAFGLSYVTGQGEFEWLPVPGLASALEWALGIAFVVGVVVALVRLVQRRPEGWVGGALLVWWVIPVAALSYNNQSLYQWHLRSTLPAGQLLAAMGISWLAQRWPRTRPAWLAAGAGLALAGFAVLQLEALSNAALPGPARSARLDEITVNASQQMGAVVQRALTTYGVSEIYSDLPDVVPTAWTGRPVDSVSWFIDDRLLIMPDNRPALYVQTGWDMPPDQLPNSRRVQTVTWPGSTYTTLDLIPAFTRAAEAQLPKVRLDWTSDTGLTLLGYTLDAPLRTGETSDVTTYWRVDSLAEQRGQYIFGPYLHVVSATGPKLVNVSAPGLPGYYYRQGDLYIETMRVPVPAQARPGTYSLELGLYDGLHAAGTTFHPAGQTPVPFYTAHVDVQ
jgi:hypothetical protein